MNTDSSLSGIAFLADSQAHLGVLRRLAVGSSTRSPRDLATATDLSPARVARILTALAVHGWVTETDNGYRATSTGTMVVEGFTHILETPKTEHRHQEGVQGISIGEGTFGVECLRDAEIVLRTESDPPAVVRQLAEWMGSAEQVRVLAYPMVPPLLEATRHAIVHGEQRFAAVFAPDVLDTVRETTSESLLAVVESDGARVFVAEAAPRCVSPSWTIPPCSCSPTREARSGR